MSRRRKQMMEKEGAGEREHGKGALKVEERVGSLSDCACVSPLYLTLDAGQKGRAQGQSRGSRGRESLVVARCGCYSGRWWEEVE
jgi:hypothetical protein